MKYTINWVELKTTTAGKELYEGEFVNDLGNKFEATIWKLDKDGKEFPNWAEIRPGGEIEANPWTKPGTNKVTLYPPTPEKRSGGTTGAYRGKQIEEAQTRKTESIEKFQTSKEESIALASAQRDAVLMVSQILQHSGMSFPQTEGIQNMIIEWRNWFLSDDFKDHPPF